jgi:hypothetical protein
MLETLPISWENEAMLETPYPHAGLPISWENEVVLETHVPTCRPSALCGRTGLMLENSVAHAPTCRPSYLVGERGCA